MTSELQDLAAATGSSVESVLEEALQNYSSLSAGTVIVVDVLGHSVPVFVGGTSPASPACKLWGGA